MLAKKSNKRRENNGTGSTKTGKLLFFVIFSSIYLQMSFFFRTFVAILCVCTYARMQRLCVQKGQNPC